MLAAKLLSAVELMLLRVHDARIYNPFDIVPPVSFSKIATIQKLSMESPINVESKRRVEELDILSLLCPAKPLFDKFIAFCEKISLRYPWKGFGT